MATETPLRKLANGKAEACEPENIRPGFTPEFLAEQDAIMLRVREEGARRIRRSCERALAMGIIDQDGNLLKEELPLDMLPDADRDFGG